MTTVDLSTLSRDALRKLQKDVEKALGSYEDRQRREALAAAEARAKEFGYTLADLIGAPGKGKSRPGQPPWYRHPEDPATTWSGRGRTPGWIREAEAAGRSRDDFLIAG